MPPASISQRDVLYLILLKNLEYILSSALGVDIEIDGLGKIKAEDTHDGLCINYVSSGYKVEIIVELGDVIYKTLYLIN